jgi:antitoxin CptB
METRLSEPPDMAETRGRPDEPREARLRRLQMRSWRRGTREMDLILGPFADAALAGFDAGALTAYEALLSENDQDLFRWIGRQGSIPDEHRSIIEMIRMHHRLG